MAFNVSRQSGWFAGILALGLVLAHQGVHAVCGAEPYAGDLLWSYPADGDQDVPIDAKIFVRMSAELKGPAWSATLNGEPVTRGQDGWFAVPELAADTDYTFHLEGRQPMGPSLPIMVEINFHTGNGRAQLADAPQVLGAQAVATRGADVLCEAVDRVYACRDTAPSDLRGVMLEAEAAVAWVDATGHVWPAACPPRVDILLAPPGDCIPMHAVSANGTLSEPVSFCPGDEASGFSGTPSDAASEAGPASSSQSASCSATQGGHGRPSGVASSLLVLLLLGLRARGQRQLQRRRALPLGGRSCSAASGRGRRRA